jgi:beta-lactamase class A
VARPEEALRLDVHPRVIQDTPMRVLAATGILLLLPAVPMLHADSLADRVAALTGPFKGTVVLQAKNLKTGREFALGADTRVRTASTIKLPVPAPWRRWSQPAARGGTNGSPSSRLTR